MSLLSIRNIKKSFGAPAALNGVSFDMAEGEILGIIGPNGAGKSTLFNVIVGVHKPDAGELFFRGKSIDRLPPHKICRTGIRKDVADRAALPHADGQGERARGAHVRAGPHEKRGERPGRRDTTFP